MKAKDLNKNVIICGNCGHHEQGAEGVEGTVHFPNRYVTLPTGGRYKCPECGNEFDVVLYGQQFISGIMSENMNLDKLPHVKLSNEIWYQDNTKWDKRNKIDANNKK